MLSESSSTSLDEEWEKDFDVTEEDILAAQEEADAVEDEDVDAEKVSIRLVLENCTHFIYLIVNILLRD